MKNALLLYAKGMAMGAADVVPGVSGGTVAFITGIYDELLRSIASLPSAVGPLLRGRVAEAWARANASFLLVLFAGILTSVFTLAKVITYLLERHPIPVWSFFFGLILVSVYLVGREIKQRNLPLLLLSPPASFSRSGLPWPRRCNGAATCSACFWRARSPSAR